MIKSLTICYVTARHEPKVEWTLDSLCKQCSSDNVHVIVIDSMKDKRKSTWLDEKRSVPCPHQLFIEHVAPKPTIWQGEHRITKEDWWAKSNALNTGIALCDTEWIAFIDDRSVIMSGWLQCIQDSMIHGYAACGSYEKRANMRVTNGEISNHGELLGTDIRTQRGFPHLTSDWYGGSGALPLEWCLRVNGFAEKYCDGLGFEDIQFGITLRNNGFDMRYDSRMRIVEDRTQGEIDGALKRGSKPSPDPNNIYLAKDYQILEFMKDSKVSGNSYDLSELRRRVLKGEPFPPPCVLDHYDWFDQQYIGDME